MEKIIIKFTWPGLWSRSGTTIKSVVIIYLLLLYDLNNINSTLLTFCVTQIGVAAREPNKLFLIINIFLIMSLSIRAAQWIDYK